jgi:hypothetical protein
LSLKVIDLTRSVITLSYRAGKSVEMRREGLLKEALGTCLL